MAGQVIGPSSELWTPLFQEMMNFDRYKGLSKTFTNGDANPFINPSETGLLGTYSELKTVVYIKRGWDQS